MLGFGASIVGTFDIPLFSQNSGNLIFQFFKLIILPTCLLMVYEDLYQTDLSLPQYSLLFFIAKMQILLINRALVTLCSRDLMSESFRDYKYSRKIRNPQ